jgi:hypothetical protein
MKITKERLIKIIKEEIEEAGDPGAYHGGQSSGESQGDAQYEVMQQMGLFHAKLIEQGHDELANEFDQILVQAQKAGMTDKKPSWPSGV